MDIIQKLELERIRNWLAALNFNDSACLIDRAISALRAAEKMAAACVRFNNPTDEGPRLHDIINDALKAWNEATNTQMALQMPPRMTRCAITFRALPVKPSPSSKPTTTPNAAAARPLP